MARTPAMQRLERLLAADARTTRREALLVAAGAGAGLGILGQIGCGGGTSGGRETPRVAIVGAGLAGLTCAHRLRQAGVHAEVYEASERIGGRCWTIRGVFAEGQIAEHGGEFIDSGHTATRGLAGELGLSLDNVLAAEAAGTKDTFFFHGAPYRDAEVVADLDAIRPALERDLRAAGYPTLYNHHTAAGVRLDHMSITDWIAANVPGGRGSRLGRLLEIAYTIEFGGESADQSALNLLYLLGYAHRGRLQLFGTSNERFHVHGGNDQMAHRLAARLDGQIATGSRLVAIARSPAGGYRLAFERGPDVRADRVVLALPFSIMRSSVDYGKAGFSPLKRTAIAEQGMGTNSKLQLQFSDRFWRAAGSNGSTYADTGYQSSWEVTRAQPGRAGILVDYTGGRIGAGFGGGGHVQRFLRQLDPVLPGAARHFNGRSALDIWAAYPWTLGSYAYYRVGQLSRFSGIERKPSGNCHFAGEHTSIAYQGYLEGAVRSGERAAHEVLAAQR